MNRELEHPLPPGMRDLLPEEARERRQLSSAVLGRLMVHGYRVVTPPAFELASVLERGLDDSETPHLIRFIEPDSGEVAALRPDMTPQIARIIATRLHDRPPPFRLAYEGTIFRRRSSRTKKHRQVPQVGVELAGVAGAGGDLELLALAADVLRQGVGLDHFVIDLADAAIVRSLLADLPLDTSARVSIALARKDAATLEELCQGIAHGSTILALSRIHGGRDAIVEAIAVLANTRAEPFARRLLALFDAAAARGLGPWLSADPAEVRGLSYYTGTIFSIYAQGPGEPIGGGGRYDDLLARYGFALPAVGFGFDLDALGWALRDRPAVPTHGVVLVSSREDDPRLAELRGLGVPAVVLTDLDRAHAYARAWGFPIVWEPGDSRTSSEVAEALEKEKERCQPS